MDGARRLAGPDQGVGGRLVIGKVRSAFQIGRGAADPLEPCGDEGGVADLPLWEEQASASSSSVTPKASAAPNSTSGIAWSDLMAERA